MGASPVAQAVRRGKHVQVSAVRSAQTDYVGAASSERNERVSRAFSPAPAEERRKGRPCCTACPASSRGKGLKWRAATKKSVDVSVFRSLLSTIPSEQNNGWSKVVATPPKEEVL